MQSNRAIYNVGLDYLDRFPRIIEALTVNDVNKVARKLLDPENYLLVVVGNKEKIGKIDLKGAPKSFGYNQEISIEL